MQVTADNPTQLAELHRLAQAFETLIDPAKRAQYDASLTGKVNVCLLSY